MNFCMQDTTSSVFPATPCPADVPPWFYGSTSVTEPSRFLCAEKQLRMVDFGALYNNSPSSNLFSGSISEGISGSSGKLVDEFHPFSKKLKCPKLEKEKEACLLDELKLHYSAPPQLLQPHLTRMSGRLSCLAAKDEKARQRRRRIAEKFGTLQRLMPWKSKMDTATMLEEATKYVKFLEAQVRTLELDAFGDGFQSLQTAAFAGDG